MKIINTTPGSLFTQTPVEVNEANQHYSGSAISQLNNQSNHATVNSAVNELLEHLMQSLNNREKLIDGLPKNLAAITRQIIIDHSVSTQMLANGLTPIVSEQREIAAKLNNLAKAVETNNLNNNIIASAPPLAKGEELINNLTTTERHEVANILRKIANSISAEAKVETERGDSNKLVMSLTMPFLFEGSTTPYPTYIHIYHELVEKDTQQNPRQETWLRIVIQTEHMGTVQTVFRLYENNLFDLKMLFSDEIAAQSFSHYIPSFRNKLENSPLTMCNLNITISNAKVSG